MSREIVASAVLSADQLPLLDLARNVPERSLPKLLSPSARVGDPVRLALFHLPTCAACGESALCARGARLVTACAGRRPRAETIQMPLPKLHARGRQRARGRA